MKLAFVITGAPYSTQAPQTAWHCAQAALGEGHELVRIFLYGDGVQLANRLIVSPANEPDWVQRWEALLDEQGIPGTACIGSALKRGVLDEREASRSGKAAANLVAAWEVAGLGDWVGLNHDADRVFYFTPGG